MRYRVNGGLKALRRQMNIGRYGTITVEEARTEAKKILGQVSQGNDPAGTKFKRRQEMTLNELCDLYFKEGVAHKKRKHFKNGYWPR